MIGPTTNITVRNFQMSRVVKDSVLYLAKIIFTLVGE
ncbi:MAG: hypothetical protein JWR61_1083 [Ferruginibacter sp.]|nr:hypothetical protein [Ferruginibacter sp.]